jgi:uncharacterized protein (TIGR00251 family)
MYIKISVNAGAKEESLVRVSDDRYEISVKEPKKDGRANKRVIEILRGLYPKSSVRIIAGHLWPNKIVEVISSGV